MKKIVCKTNILQEHINMGVETSEGHVTPVEVREIIENQLLLAYAGQLKEEKLLTTSAEYNSSTYQPSTDFQIIGYNCDQSEFYEIRKLLKDLRKLDLGVIQKEIVEKLYNIIVE